MTDQGSTALADQPEERVGKYTPPREAVVNVLAKRLGDRLQDVEGGPWDGVRVVTSKDIEEALDEPLPPASEFSAEITTPGWLTVNAVCRRCGIAQDISVDLDTETKTSRNGTELSVKGKSKARTHVCFQTTIAEAASEQGSFELSDIVGTDHETDDDASDEAAVDDDDPEAPVCSCGKPKVRAPRGRWVCTNPDHDPKD